MTARHWVGAAVAWLVLVAGLLALADRNRPVVGTAATIGVVLLVANARYFARRQPAPLSPRASARAETLLGAALVGLAIASAVDHLALFVGLVLIAVVSAVWLAMSISSSE